MKVNNLKSFEEFVSKKNAGNSVQELQPGPTSRLAREPEQLSNPGVGAMNP